MAGGLTSGCATVNMMDVGGEANVNSQTPAQTKLSEAAEAVCTGCKARDLVKANDGWNRLGRWLSGARPEDTASEHVSYSDRVFAKTEDVVEAQLHIAGDVRWLATSLTKARLASAALRSQPVDVRRADVQAFESALVCAEVAQQLAQTALLNTAPETRGTMMDALETELTLTRTELEALAAARLSAQELG
jgi:hypothetical protein